jgi:hypothetical protein
MSSTSDIIQRFRADGKEELALELEIIQLRRERLALELRASQRAIRKAKINVQYWDCVLRASRYVPINDRPAALHVLSCEPGAVAAARFPGTESPG